MIHLFRYKWFYLTLGSWCFLSAIGAWALILSPLHGNARKISEFSSRVNGTLVRNRIFTSAGPLTDSLDAVTDEWKSEGWSCASGGVNLASLFLNAPQGALDPLSACVQLRIFKRRGALRFLGLLADPIHEQTFQWTSEIPEGTFDGSRPAEIDFPLQPPRDAAKILLVGSDHLKSLIWSMPPLKDPADSFSRHYASQGFDGKILSRQNDGTFFLLQKGSTRLFADVQNSENKYVIFLVH